MTCENKRRSYRSCDEQTSLMSERPHGVQVRVYRHNEGDDRKIPRSFQHQLKPVGHHVKIHKIMGQHRTEPVDGPVVCGMC